MRFLEYYRRGESDRLEWRLISGGVTEERLMHPQSREGLCEVCERRVRETETTSEVKNPKEELIDGSR